jgi:hypothetical protein
MSLPQKPATLAQVRTRFSGQPGQVMAITALVLTPPLFLLSWLHLFGAAMATGGDDEAYTHAFQRVMPWVWSAGLGSLAVPIVLCALLPDADDGREVARRWVAAIQLVLLLAPLVLLRSLPFPD